MPSDSFVVQLRPQAVEREALVIESHAVPIQFVRNVRARRYVVRVKRDGSVRVTIPRGGSAAFAVDFARQNIGWIQRQRKKCQAEARQGQVWSNGSELLLRGERVTLTVKADGELQLVTIGEHVFTVPAHATDLRPSVENYLWCLAEKELKGRTFQLAAHHGLTFNRVVIRNQRTRWGSCSPARTISLNWRLIQAPPEVRDYLILHELMHLREMNHSARFWRWVQAAFPEYQAAEAWLDAHSYLLH